MSERVISYTKITGKIKSLLSWAGGSALEGQPAVLRIPTQLGFVSSFVYD